MDFHSCTLKIGFKLQRQQILVNTGWIYCHKKHSKCTRNYKGFAWEYSRLTLRPPDVEDGISHCPVISKWVSLCLLHVVKVNGPFLTATYLKWCMVFEIHYYTQYGYFPWLKTYILQKKQHLFVEYQGMYHRYSLKSNFISGNCRELYV